MAQRRLRWRVLAPVLVSVANAYPYMAGSCWWPMAPPHNNTVRRTDDMHLAVKDGRLWLQSSGPTFKGFLIKCDGCDFTLDPAVDVGEPQYREGCTTPREAAICHRERSQKNDASAQINCRRAGEVFVSAVVIEAIYEMPWNVSLGIHCDGDDGSRPHDASNVPEGYTATRTGTLPDPEFPPRLREEPQVTEQCQHYLNLLAGERHKPRQVPCVRRELRAISREERFVYFHALSALKFCDLGEDYTGAFRDWDHVVLYHAWASLNSTGNMAHFWPAFVPWHTAFVAEVERSLQEYAPALCMPYWDWTLDQQMFSWSSSWFLSDEYYGKVGTRTGRAGWKTPDPYVSSGPFKDWRVPRVDKWEPLPKHWAKRFNEIYLRDVATNNWQDKITRCPTALCLADEPDEPEPDDPYEGGFHGWANRRLRFTAYVPGTDPADRFGDRAFVERCLQKQTFFEFHCCLFWEPLGTTETCWNPMVEGRLHGVIHANIGGQMMDRETVKALQNLAKPHTEWGLHGDLLLLGGSPNDPVFFALHLGMDKIFMDWFDRVGQHIATDEDPCGAYVNLTFAPGHHLNDMLVPPVSPFPSTGGGPNTIADVCRAYFPGNRTIQYEEHSFTKDSPELYQCPGGDGDFCCLPLEDRPWYAQSAGWRLTCIFPAWPLFAAQCASMLAVLLLPLLSEGHGGATMGERFARPFSLLLRRPERMVSEGHALPAELRTAASAAAASRQVDAQGRLILWRALLSFSWHHVLRYACFLLIFVVQRGVQPVVLVQVMLLVFRIAYAPGSVSFDHAFAIAGIFVLNSLLIAMCHPLCLREGICIGIQWRALVIGALSKQALKTAPRSSGLSVQALMAVDAEQFLVLPAFTPLEFVFLFLVYSAWVIYFALEMGAIIVGLALAALLVQSLAAMRIDCANHLRWAAAQQRMDWFSDILASLPVLVKMGRTEQVRSFARHLRGEELAISRQRLAWDGLATCFSSGALVAVTVFALVLFVYGPSGEMIDVTVFPVLFVLKQLMVAPGLAGFFATNVAHFAGAARRVAEFLQAAPQPVDVKVPAAPTQAGVVRCAAASFQLDGGSGVTSPLDLEIPSGGLVLILGTTSSGKTTLLRGLLGEMPLSRGSCTVLSGGSRVAYAGQEPWLPSGTAREIVTLWDEFSAFDRKRFFSSLQLVSTDGGLEDFESGFSEGLQIEEGGTNLSGGQRRQLAFARLLYLEPSCDVFIIDDPVSQLDGRATHRVLKDGVLGALSRRTRIVAMPACPKYLFESASEVLVVDGANGILAQGKPSSMPQDIVDLFASDAETGDSPGSRRSRRRSHMLPSSPVMIDHGPSRATIDRSLKSCTWIGRIASFLGVPIWPLLLMALAVLAAELLPMAMEVVIALWLGSIEHIFDDKWIVWLFVLMLSSVAVLMLALGLLVTGAHLLSRRVHERALDAVLAMPIDGFAELSERLHILQWFTEGLGGADLSLVRDVFFVCRTTSYVAGVIFVTVLCGGWVLVATVLPVLMYVWLFRRSFMRSTQALQEPDTASRSAFVEAADQAVGEGAADHIRAFGIADLFVRRLGDANDIVSRVSYYKMQAFPRMIFRLDFISSVVMCLVLASISLARATKFASIIGLLLRTENTARLAPFVGLTLSVTSMLTGGLVDWALTSMAGHATVRSFDDFATIIDAPREEDRPGCSRQAVSDETLALELRQVAFEYGDVQALRGVSLAVEAGGSAALLGRNGAGKSSIFNAILRTAGVSAGEILIGGRSVYDFPLAQLRGEIVTFLPQDPAFVVDRLGECVDPQGLLSETARRKALAEVGVETCDASGAERLVSDLSVGERRLVLLAEVLFRGPRPLTLLDEPTADLDVATEQRTIAAIKKLVGKTTLLIITHSRPVLDIVDRHIHIKRGETAPSEEVGETEAPKLIPNPVLPLAGVGSSLRGA